MSVQSSPALTVGERLRLGSAASSRPAPAAVPSSADVAVVGAGVIGLSIAWRLARRGLSVAVFDRGAAGCGASLAASGMLAAAAELEPGGADLLLLARESQRLWPAFRASLEAAAGLSIDYRDEGTLVVALGREEVERLRFRQNLQARLGLSTHWLGGSEVRAMEPGLRPSVVAGLFCPEDHQVDPRRVVPALRRACEACGGILIENCAVEALEMAGGRVAGVSTAAGPCRAETVVLAAGAWTGDGGLLPPGLRLPVRPLKGQALALRTTPRTGTLSHVVWTEQIHLAPKGDKRLVVGASVEECGFDPAVTAGGVYALLEGARWVLPSIEDMEIEAIWTGFRPTSDDDAPVIGTTTVEGLVVATGHHRNGFLLAPVTAQAIVDLLLRGEPTDIAAAFGIGRFEQPGTQPAQPVEDAHEARRQRTGT